MLLKKEILFKLIEDNKIKTCTIIGIPTNKLKDAYFSGTDLTKMFEEDKVDYKVPKDKRYDVNIETESVELSEIDYMTNVGIYFPIIDHKYQCCELCSISIKDSSLTVENIEKIISNYFDEILYYYQFSLSPYHFNKIASNESLTFGDILLFCGDKQAEIARNIGKSRQIMSDMKSGKCKCNIEVLALLMREYPLLPWNYFIKSFID